LTLTSLKTLNKELPRAYNDVGITNIRNLATCNTGAVAGYLRDCLYINPDRFNASIQNPKKFYKENVTEESKRYGIRRLAIDYEKNVRGYIIDHEIGHLVFEKYKFSGKNSELAKMRSLTEKNGNLKKISRYAVLSEDKEDFFAEIYAMYARKDDSLPKYLVDYVEKVKKG